MEPYRKPDKIKTGEQPLEGKQTVPRYEREATFESLTGPHATFGGKPYHTLTAKSGSYLGRFTVYSTTQAEELKEFNHGDPLTITYTKNKEVYLTLVKFEKTEL